MATIFPFFSNPLRLGLILLFCRILIVWNLAFFSSTFWISYILILVLVGGLIVVFIYVSLLASNDLFLRSSSSIILALGAGVILFISFVGGAFGFKRENLTEEINALSFSFYSDSPIRWVSKLYSQELGGLTFFFSFLFIIHSNYCCFSF